MIVVTHEIGFAREVADTVVFLDGGRIVESGPPASVLDQPAPPARPRVPRSRPVSPPWLRLRQSHASAERTIP